MSVMAATEYNKASPKLIPKRHVSGFTLVELLIVIVIIAILAAISIVAYNGIQQRATNTSIKSDVSQIAKLLMMHETAEGGFTSAIKGARYCATLDDDCRDYKGDVINDGWYRDAFVDSMNKVGTLPQSSAKPSSTYYGVSIVWDSDYMLGGEQSPIMINFFLKGKSQSCTDIPGTISVVDSGIEDQFIPRKNSSSNVNNSGVTRCYVMFPAK